MKFIKSKQQQTQYTQGSRNRSGICCDAFRNIARKIL